MPRQNRVDKPARLPDVGSILETVAALAPLVLPLAARAFQIYNNVADRTAAEGLLHSASVR